MDATESNIAKRARVMPRPEMATEDLFDHAFAALSWLRSLMQRRAKRDAACNTLTNLAVGVEFLGKRLATVAFEERAPSVIDDEEEARQERQTEATLADLFAEPDPEVAHDIAYLQARFCGHCNAALEEVICEECREALAGLCGHQERLRRRDFTVAMELFCKGAGNIAEVAKRVVTTMQPTMPGLLEDHFGVSLTSVGARIGEDRQVTHARKKRTVESTLKKGGAKGYKGLGGARGEQHRERCAKAQMGNKSRATGEAKKRSR